MVYQIRDKQEYVGDKEKYDRRKESRAWRDEEEGNKKKKKKYLGRQRL